jgi:hypothetical protein
VSQPLFRALRLVVLFSVLSVPLVGCDVWSYLHSGGGGPSDAPGSLSYYSQLDFTRGLDPFCLLSTDTSCDFDVNASLAQPLQATYKWTLNNFITDGIINGIWTSAETTEAQFISDKSSFVYISSHGGLFQGGKAIICLRDCVPGFPSSGGTTAISPTDLPFAWKGPNWLIVDACKVVQPGYGWESRFGGNLHGILGFNVNTNGINGGGLQYLAKLIGTYVPAMDAWEKVVAYENVSPQIAMLVPTANEGDVIEAAGGPHFGINGMSFPTYFYTNTKGQLTTQVVARRVPGNPASSPSLNTTVYSLVPEQMNESAWYQRYAGDSGTISYPSSNEHDYDSPSASVRHFGASGGVVVALHATGTAQGISQAAAYQYALSFVQNNGGLPADAALTFQGTETMSPVPPMPTCPGGYLLPAGYGMTFCKALIPYGAWISNTFPYPSVRQYVFIWRHAYNGIVSGDKIQVNVDDDGGYIIGSTTHGSIYYWTGRWNPVPHVNTYVRVWRTLGAPIGSISRVQYSLSPELSGSAPAGGALCSTEMSSPVSVAAPCDVYTNAATLSTDFIDPASGSREATSEAL